MQKGLFRLVPAVTIACALPWAGVVAQAPPKRAPLTDTQLFNPEKRAPLAEWTDATVDGSRKAVSLERPDGTVLRGWLLPAVDPRAPVVVTFRGNNETLADAYSQERDAFFATALNFNVITFDYRGTGFSTGTISLGGARDDALAIYDYAEKLAAGRPVFVCGWSLGSIFAGNVAANRNPAGVILLDPIGSAPILARTYHSSLVTPLMASEMNNVGALTSYAGPLLIVHGTSDRVVPIDNGLADYAASPSKDKRFVRVPGSGHSQTIWSIQADDAIVAFIKDHVPALPKAPD
jgi:uncharacterized protein